MKDSKKVAKQVAIKNMAPITLCARKIDQLQGKLDTAIGAKFQAQKELATEVLKHKSTKKSMVIKTEHARLITYAKGIVAHDGLILHHEKNLWSGVSNLILKRLAGNKVIKTDAGKDDKGNKVTAQTKVSELPETAKSVATNASAIRSAVGMGDKRSTNTPKTRAPSGEVSSAPQKHSSAMTPKNWDDAIAFGFKAGVKVGKAIVNGIIANKENVVKVGASLGYTIIIGKTPPKLKK